MIYHCWCWPWSPEMVVWFKHCKVTVHTLLFRREWLGSPALKEGRKRLGCTSSRGRYCMGSKYATLSMALWPMSDFDLKAFEIQKMQKKAFPELPLYLKQETSGTSLVVQWLRLLASKCRGPRFDIWSGNWTGSHMPQLRVLMLWLNILRAETKTRNCQIKKCFF